MPVHAAVDGGFTIDDFPIDTADTVTCPTGSPPGHRHPHGVFGAAAGTARCGELHHRQAAAPCGCTSTTACCAARADWAADPGLREDYMTHRPNVERAIAQVATWRERRLKLRYQGQAASIAAPPR